MKAKKFFWRRLIIYSIYIVLLGLFQVTLPASFALEGQRADLTLILAVLSGYMFGSTDGLVVGFFAGLMRDLLAGRTLGLGMLSLMYSGFLASLLLRRFFRRNILFGLVQIAFFTLVYELALVILTFMVPLQPDISYSFTFLASQASQRLPAQTAINLIAGLPLIFLLAWLGPYQRNRQLDEEGGLAGASLWRVM